MCRRRRLSLRGPTQCGHPSFSNLWCAGAVSTVEPRVWATLAALRQAAVPRWPVGGHYPTLRIAPASNVSRPRILEVIHRLAGCRLQALRCWGVFSMRILFAQHLSPSQEEKMAIQFILGFVIAPAAAP
ncbi:hypothetical protein FA95DRAFT_1564852 [Auriscalpium vulgare]|uniref:Uncharacterized protein n=1 Tax=Auriscalpium vulgare TaxID=40419 RepID=A0ACB8RE45_9AGAM|nr:hypothetical protein FA95DRAFT_1564852 [Auriscalpium vulgare]